MATVTDFTALLSANRWNGMTTKKTPVFVTYSFLTNGEVPSLNDYMPYPNDGYSAFSSQQKSNFRKAIAKMEKTAGIKFIEVDDPDNAMIKVMNTSGSGYGGWASYGNAKANYSLNGYLVIDGNSNYAPGTNDFETILHELGHSAGLKHPFQGNPKLDPSVDNDDHTLMSYTSNGVADTDFAHLDKDALKNIYGGKNGIKDAWSWSWSDAKEKFNLTGSGKADKLIAPDVKTTIKGKGGNDIIFGRDGDDVLQGNGGNDKIGGGDGDDKLLGGGGNDSFLLSYGSDFFNGGKGTDTLDFKKISFDVWLDLAITTGQVVGYGINTFRNIENIEGGKKNDRLKGNEKSNTIDGNNGSDLIEGRGGNDRLEGGKGKDTLTGGDGKDKFIYRNNDNRDAITDFSSNDKLLIDDNNWTGSKTANQVINQFGEQVGANFVFKFGGDDVLKVLNTTESDIMGHLGII